MTEAMFAYLEHSLGSSVDDTLSGFLHFVKEAHIFKRFREGSGC